MRRRRMLQPLETLASSNEAYAIAANLNMIPGGALHPAQSPGKQGKKALALRSRTIDFTQIEKRKTG